MGFPLSYCLLICSFALNAFGKPSESLPATLSEEVIRQAFSEAEQFVAKENQITCPLKRSQGDAAVRQSVQQGLTPLALDMDKIQMVFERATRLIAHWCNLTDEQIADGLPSLNLKNALKGLPAAVTVKKCKKLKKVSCENADGKYRTIDGSCNNMKNPNWGMANSNFELFSSAHFADGVCAFRNSVDGLPLPEPRDISLKILNDLNRPAESHTHMVMAYAQFLTHDIAWTPVSVDGNNDSIDCCIEQGNKPNQCAKIEVKKGDKFYSKHSVTCLNFVRASRYATCSLGPRENTNQVSAFIDLSQVYGYSKELSEKHRAKDGKGSLKTSSHKGITLLPHSPKPDSDACSYQKQDLKCFFTGDDRVNQHPSLTSLHTIFTRYHNWLSSTLSVLNPHWDDEKLYQEARRIAGAQFQMITFGELLPQILAPKTRKEHQLEVKESGYTQYDPSENPAISPEFGVAAFRFGHSKIDGKFARLSAARNDSEQMKNIFFYPFSLYDGAAEEWIKGLTDSQSQSVDRWMTNGVTHHLYQERGDNHIGLDLASINIQRGRDTGLPPYTKMVEFCGGPKIESFGDLYELFDKENVPLFEKVYRYAKDIDLFSGGLAEKPLDDAILGYTFSCVVAKQFHRLKFGDRFYFEHENQEGSFTPGQLKEIRKTKLATILCQGSDIEELQSNVFRYKSKSNPLIKCREYPRIDLTLWKE